MTTVIENLKQNESNLEPRFTESLKTKLPRTYRRRLYLPIHVYELHIMKLTMFCVLLVEEFDLQDAI